MRSVVALLFAVVVVVNGHGWLTFPEPRGFVGDAEASASQSGPCGKSGNYTVTEIFNNEDLVIENTIGGGHGNGPCRIAIAATDNSSSAFNANVLSGGFSCPQSRSNNATVTIRWTDNSYAYLQFLWRAGDGGMWYNCARVFVRASNTTRTIEEVSRDASVTRAFVGGESHNFYSSLPPKSIVSVGITGPTGLKLAGQSGFVPTETTYTRLVSTSAASGAGFSFCGPTRDNTTMFVSVISPAGLTGSYTLDYNSYSGEIRFVDPVPQVRASLTAGGNRFYYTEAYSTYETPKRVVVTSVDNEDAALTVSRATTCNLNDEDREVGTGIETACVDLGDKKGVKYLNVESDTNIQFTLGVEKGKCKELEMSGASAHVVSVAVVASLTFLLALF